MPSGRQIKHPSWRVYRALEEARLKPKDFGLREDITIFVPYRRIDELTDALTKALTDPNYVDTTFPVLECLDIFKDINGRQLVEGLLLSGQSINEIASVIDSSPDLVMTYASLFYDVSIFSNRIEKLVYLKEGTAGQDSQAKNEAFMRGPEHFKAKNNLSSDKLKVDTLVADALSLAYIQLINNADDENKALQAQGWGNLFVKLAAQLQKKGGGKSIKDFIVDLQSDDPPTEKFEDLK